ncbi:MAG: NAD-dependent epimerase/dehydratase family protein [Christensenellales bacterium]
MDSVKQGLDAVIVHPSGILGPFDYGHGHLTQMVENYLNGHLKACVRGGYDFVDVRDVADGIIAAAEKGKKGACYILSNHYMPVEDVIVSGAQGQRQAPNPHRAAHVVCQRNSRPIRIVL